MATLVGPGASPTIADTNEGNVSAGEYPIAVAVNPVTNKVYVANYNSSNVTVIDGATNSTATVDSKWNPSAIAVDPVTNKVYVANYSSNNVTAVTPQPSSTAPLTVAISGLPGNTTYLASATFAFTATSAYTPTAPPVQQIYYQVDTWTGTWLPATPTGTVASGTVSLLGKGTHIIYSFAVDGEEATSIDTGAGSSPIIGHISAYEFLASGASVALTSARNPSTFGKPATFTATVSAITPAAIAPTGVVTFAFDGVTHAAATLSSGTATYVTSTLPAGSHPVTATYGGDSTFGAATSAAANQIVNRASTVTVLSSSANPSTFGQPVTFTATVTTDAGTPTGVATFGIDGLAVGTVTLSSGTATYVASMLLVGSHSVMATYSGDNSFDASSGSLSERIAERGYRTC